MEHELFVTIGKSEQAVRDTIVRIRSLYTWYSPHSDDAKIRERLFTPGAHVDILDDGETVAAFAICVPMELANGEVCLFRHGTIIGEKYRSRGLYKQLLQIGLARHRPQWHATRTQNPRVYETWCQQHGDTLRPRYGVAPTADELSVAVQVSHGVACDPLTLAVRNVYREDRSGVDYHACRNPDIRALFQETLGVHDAFLLLARVR